MRINQLLLCLLFIGLSVQVAQGQTAVDALRYGELLPSGTARMVGVGGAMSSIGADMGSLNINPAGLGVYRKSEFTLTPGFQLSQVGSSLNGGSENSNSNSKMGLENIGLVFYKGYDNQKFKSFNFGVAINRVANFNRSVTYEGKTAGSIINSFQGNAQGFFANDLDPFTSQVAESSGAIFVQNGDPADRWSSDFDTFEDLAIDRSETITTTGGVSDLLLALGFNISHKLYLGISGNFPFVRLEETRSYAEDDRTDDAIPFFRDLTYDQSITTTGLGAGLKAGFIYRITNEIRLGGAVHSPTKYRLSDNFTSSMSYFYINEEDPSLPLIDGSGDSPAGSFSYALQTPWRINGGVSVVLKKFGFISLDVEHFDYSSMSYDFAISDNNTNIQVAQENVNGQIREDFTDALNIKLGAEYLIKKFRIRAGYGIYGTPFDAENKGRNVLSLGAGFRGDNAYIDLAFRNTSTTENYTPYNSPIGFNQQVANDINTNNLLLTVGYRF